jgi:NhaA family Na+:H+ antiporter
MKTDNLVAPFDIEADRTHPGTAGVGPRLWSFASEHLLALPAGVLIALVWANLAPGSYYRATYPMAFAVNDVAMVFFFGWITKEVVEATLPGGVLHSWRRAALPIAVSGVVVAASVVAFAVAVRLVGAPMLEQAWVASAAMDLAFGYFVARLIFGPRSAVVPFFLLVAMSANAIGFGLLAQTGTFRDAWPGLAAVLMAGALGYAVLLRTLRFTSVWPYILGAGGLSWAGLYFGGVHPALALVPIVPFLPHGKRDPGFFVDAKPDARDTLNRFELWCRHPAQAALFLFGLVNGGVPLLALERGVLALPLALVVARPLALLAGAGFAVASGLHLSKSIGWRELLVLGFVSSIGFTLALFFASATLGIGQALNETRAGALLSVTAGVLAFGAAWLLGVGRFARDGGGNR